jgi:KDO2-lipid IV(A) lauroyltransferase
LLHWLVYALVRPCLIVFGSMGPDVGYWIGRRISWLLKNLFAYRRTVIEDNLKGCFKGFNQVELNRIVNAYYQHLGELIAENIFLPYLSDLRLMSSSTFVNADVLDSYYLEGRSVIVVMGHTGNWEWTGLSAALRGKHVIRAVYKPLSNPHFNRYFKNIRSSFDMRPISMEDVSRVLLSDSGSPPTCYTFIADQSPTGNDLVQCSFLHRETLFMQGWAKLACKKNLPVLFAETHRKRRGKYETRFTVISESPINSSPEVLVSDYAQKLEKEILSDLPGWLWSHRRWKHLVTDRELKF